MAWLYRYPFIREAKLVQNLNKANRLSIFFTEIIKSGSIPLDDKISSIVNNRLIWLKKERPGYF